MSVLDEIIAGVKEDLAERKIPRSEIEAAAYGADPVLITVIVDRGGTCAAMAEAAGIPYIPMLTAPDLGFDFGS